MTQYYFLDESGDPGLDGSASSSSHFVIAMAQLSERKPLTELAVVRREFHLPSIFEFKYQKTTAAQKSVLFRSIQAIPFRVRAVAIDKSGLQKQFGSVSGQDFIIEFVAKLTLRASDMDIANDILIIDGATRGYLRALRIRISKECRQLKRVRPFKKIISADSKRDDGLQVADLIVGAVRDYVAKGEDRYFRTFASKVVDLWEISASK